MNTAALPGLAPAAASASPSAEGKSATRDAAATGNGDRFERLLRKNEAAKNPPATASTENTGDAVETAPAVAAKPREADPPEASEDRDDDTRDWPPAALALLGIPWATAAQPTTPAAPETAAGIASGSLPGALAPAIDALPANIEGEAAPPAQPAAAGVNATIDMPADALPVDNTASSSRPAQNPLSFATQLAATPQAIAPEALPIAQTLKELTDTLRQGADGDTAAPTINALVAPVPSANGLPRTATVNPLAAPTPELHSEHFDEAIGTRLTWMADQKIGHAHIRMTPEQLGPVEIRLRLDGDRVHADFNSAQPEVRQALESSLPKLREMLGQHGFQLAHADVGHRHDSSARHATPQGGDGSPTGMEGTDAMDSRAGTNTPTRLALRGLLDAYA